MFVALLDRIGFEQSLDEYLKDVASVLFLFDCVYTSLKFTERGQVGEDALLDPMS